MACRLDRPSARGSEQRDPQQGGQTTATRRGQDGAEPSRGALSDNVGSMRGNEKGISAADRTNAAQDEHDDGEPLPLRATYVLSRLSRVVQRILEALLREHGLTLPQYTLLTVLRRRPGLSNAQLARRAYISPQSMQEVLRALEDRGLVQRQRAPGNRRMLLARLTPRGERLTAQAEAAAAAADEAMLAGFTPTQRARFVKALQACVVSLGGGLARPSSPAE